MATAAAAAKNFDTLTMYIVIRKDLAKVRLWTVPERFTRTS
jgi:hypothetical protein